LRGLLEQKKNIDAGGRIARAIFGVDKPIDPAIPAFIRRAAG